MKSTLSFPGPGVRRYLQNRVARIYPLYFLLTALAIGGGWLGWPGFPTAPVEAGTAALTATQNNLLLAFLNLTLLKGFFKTYFISGIFQSWSLTVEECFYLAAPLVLLAARNRWKWLVLFSLLVLGMGWALVWLSSMSPVYLYGFMGSVKFMLNWTFFGRVTEFALGMALAFFIKRRPQPAGGGYRATAWGWRGYC
jgi:peptidoglycan/LPS O-acetylase OafA/YrhL